MGPTMAVQRRAATHILLTRALVLEVGVTRVGLPKIYRVAPSLLLAATGQAAAVMAAALSVSQIAGMALLEVVALEVTLAGEAMGEMTERPAGIMALGAALLVAELLQILFMLTTYREAVGGSVYTGQGQGDLLP